MATLNRLLSNSRNFVPRTALNLVKTVKGAREYGHVVAIPPRNKMSTTEKAVLCSLLGISTWAIPAWVLYYLPEYQGEDRNAYTGK